MIDRDKQIEIIRAVSTRAESPLLKWVTDPRVEKILDMDPRAIAQKFNPVSDECDTSAPEPMMFAYG